MPLSSGKHEPIRYAGINNLLLKVKSLKPLSKDIEELAENELKELEQYGIDVKGLFSVLEPEALRIAEDYGDFYVTRYEAEGKRLMTEEPEKFKNLVRLNRFNSDGTLPEKRRQDQFRMGVTEKAFELFLQQIQVPYIHNDPTMDWREKENFRYDFYIPFFGTINIKSATLANYPTKTNINCREFMRENPDFVITYMILDMDHPKWLKMMGYLGNSEVQAYTPVEGARPYWSIPTVDFEKHDGNQLLMRLMIVKHAIKCLETRRIYELF